MVSSLGLCLCRARKEYWANVPTYPPEEPVETKGKKPASPKPKKVGEHTHSSDDMCSEE